MPAQGVDGGKIPCKLCLGQAGVNLVMADLVQQDRRPAFATFQFRHEVVQALPRLRRNGALA